MTDAIQKMNEANRIIEDFPTSKYAIYTLIYALEIIAVFWFAMKLV